MNKEALRAAVLAAVEAELARQTHAALDARDESISEESRPENKYDTHAQEAAYLAEGQARLAAELAAAIAAWRGVVFPPADARDVRMGSLVTLQNGPRRDHVLLGPANGGLDLRFDERAITVVTVASPLGRQLLGKSAGAVLQPSRKGSPAPRLAAIE